MELQDEISINKYAQDLIAIEDLLDNFLKLEGMKQKEYLNNLLYLITQSKVIEDDTQQAIVESKLKDTYTPCVLLRKGKLNVQLPKIVALPENEYPKALILLLNLFKIGYKRRFSLEKNHPEKWWYWDLSDENRINAILKLMR